MTRNMIVMKSDITGSRHSTLGGPQRSGLPAASSRITTGEGIPPIRTARRSAMATILATPIPINANAVWSAKSEDPLTTRGTAIVTPERVPRPRSLAALDRPRRAVRRAPGAGSRPLRAAGGWRRARRGGGAASRSNSGSAVWSPPGGRVVELELPGFGAEWVVRGEKGIVIPDTRWPNRRLEGISRDITRWQSRPVTSDRPVRIVRSDRSCCWRQGEAPGHALLFGLLTVGIVVTGSGAATMLGHRSRSCLTRGARACLRLTSSPRFQDSMVDSAARGSATRTAYRR